MVKGIIEKIYGMPCWSVKQGHGSFLTFEFGQPSLRVAEPYSGSRRNKYYKYRRITLHGEWHLRIYCCSWQIFLEDKLVINDEHSRRNIAAALEYLDGQKIADFSIDPVTSDSVFYFDLGAVLKTEHYRDSINEQWMLYGPNENVLSVRDDGKYCYGHGNTPPNEEIWIEIQP